MSSAPPPKASPEVPRDLPGAEPEPTTGSHAIPASLKDMKTLRTSLKAEIAAAKKASDWRTIVIFLITTLGTLGAGFLSVRAVAQDAGAPVEKRVTFLEQTQGTLMSEVRELRLDLREAYKSQRYDRPSPRLEVPPPPIPLPKDAGP